MNTLYDITTKPTIVAHSYLLYKASSLHFFSERFDHSLYIITNFWKAWFPKPGRLPGLILLLIIHVVSWSRSQTEVQITSRYWKPSCNTGVSLGLTGSDLHWGWLGLRPRLVHVVPMPIREPASPSFSPLAVCK